LRPPSFGFQPVRVQPQVQEAPLPPQVQEEAPLPPLALAPALVRVLPSPSPQLRLQRWMAPLERQLSDLVQVRVRARVRVPALVERQVERPLEYLGSAAAAVAVSAVSAAAAAAAAAAGGTG
jgi:hypothetical protein